MRAIDGNQIADISTPRTENPQQQIQNIAAAPVQPIGPTMLQPEPQRSPFPTSTASATGGLLLSSTEPQVISEDESSTAGKSQQSLAQQMQTAILKPNSADILDLLEKGISPLDNVPDMGLSFVEFGMLWLSAERSALHEMLKRIPTAQRNAMADKLYSAAKGRANALGFDCLLKWGVPANQKIFNDILPCISELSSRGIADGMKMYLKNYRQHLPDMSLDLGDALLLAAKNGHTACIEVLLDFFDVQDDTHCEQICKALEAAACASSISVSSTLIDWLKNSNAFDEEDFFPLEQSLTTIPDQGLFCLAEAGYPFTPESFPLDRPEKTISAIQDILFGKGLALSPFSKLYNAQPQDLMEVWERISQCETLNNKHQFDFEPTCSELLLLGFRKPVANWLTDMLNACLMAGRQKGSNPSKLSDKQVQMLGIFMLNELQIIPPELESPDTLVASQCRMLADVAKHCINTQFKSAEFFFSQCINSMHKNMEVDTVWLNKLLRNQFGLPDSLIKHIDSALVSALEEGLSLPVVKFELQGLTCKETHALLEMQVMQNALRCMPKKLLKVLDSHALLADANAAENHNIAGFIVYEGGTNTLIRQFCHKMQALIDAGRERIERVVTVNEAVKSDADSGSDEEDGDSGFESSTPD